VVQLDGRAAVAGGPQGHDVADRLPAGAHRMLGDHPVRRRPPVARAQPARAVRRERVQRHLRAGGGGEAARGEDDRDGRTRLGRRQLGNAAEALAVEDRREHLGV
jgi:hypothetical protein